MRIPAWWGEFKLFANRFTQPHKRSKLSRYAFPFLLVGALAAFDVLLGDVRQQTPLLLLTFIIILSAWYGGLGPGVLAIILTSILSNYLFLNPRFSFTGSEGVTVTVIFILQGLIISMISEAKRQADIQKDEFISFASHELKNPLAVLKGYASMILKKSKDDKIKEYAKISDEYIDKITLLINELLDVTKIETGKLTLHKAPLDLYEIVNEIIHDQKLVSHTHKIKLSGIKKCRVYADKIRIGQVITNMIINAVKYSPGKKIINVMLKKNENSVIVSVQDYGIGLSEKDRQKVFERFYRVQNTKTQGLGLGLYISRQIIDLHRGRLWVDSRAGKGSTFYFTLPLLNKK